MNQHAAALEAAYRNQVRVTVTRRDGKTYTGVPRPSWEANTYTLQTGKRGRPAKVHVDDVESLEEVPAE